MGDAQAKSPELFEVIQRLEAMEMKSVGPESKPDMSVLMSHLEALCASCRDQALQAASPTDASEIRSRVEEMASPILSDEKTCVAIERLQMDVARLSRDLAEERKERFGALAEVGRLTEDVAKAGAASIERVERRLAKMIPRHDDLDAPQGTLHKDVPPVVWRNRDRDGSNGDADDLRDALGSSLAVCIREVDAELRMELAGRANSISVQLRAELRSEIASRIAATEHRLASIEGSLGAEIKRLADEMGGRLGKLEGAVSTSTQLVESLVNKCRGEWQEHSSSRPPSPRQHHTMVPGSLGAPGDSSATLMMEASEPEIPRRLPESLAPTSVGHTISEELKGQLETLVQAVSRTFHTNRPPQSREMSLHGSMEAVFEPRTRTSTESTTASSTVSGHHRWKQNDRNLCGAPSLTSQRKEARAASVDRGMGLRRSTDGSVVSTMSPQQSSRRESFHEQFESSQAFSKVGVSPRATRTVGRVTGDSPSRARSAARSIVGRSSTTRAEGLQENCGSVDLQWQQLQQPHQMQLFQTVPPVAPMHSAQYSALTGTRMTVGTAASVNVPVTSGRSMSPSPQSTGGVPPSPQHRSGVPKPIPTEVLMLDPSRSNVRNCGSWSSTPGSPTPVVRAVDAIPLTPRMIRR